MIATFWNKRKKKLYIIEKYSPTYQLVTYVRSIFNIIIVYLLLLCKCQLVVFDSFLFRFSDLLNINNLPF